MEFNRFNAESDTYDFHSQGKFIFNARRLYMSFFFGPQKAFSTDSTPFGDTCLFFSALESKIREFNRFNTERGAIHVFFFRLLKSKLGNSTYSTPKATHMIQRPTMLRIQHWKFRTCSFFQPSKGKFIFNRGQYMLIFFLDCNEEDKPFPTPN